MTCVYGTRDGDELVVDHRLYATAAAVWLVGLPVVAAFGVGMIAWVWPRERHVSATCRRAEPR